MPHSHWTPHPDSAASRLAEAEHLQYREPVIIGEKPGMFLTGMEMLKFFRNVLIACCVVAGILYFAGWF